MTLLSIGIDAAERGLVPDVILRAAIRRLCSQRLCECSSENLDASQREFRRFVDSMRQGPIAPVPEKANEQHYEVPPDFFCAVLGPHRKYSSCFWSSQTTTLADAETAALDTTCQRAELVDGQRILELGCGWGSLSLWMAEHFPGSQVLALSNSAQQRSFIETQATSRGLGNLQVITADMNRFEFAPQSFDRIVSVEMFEHMRNYERLLERISSWLRPDGKLFVHHFCHRLLAYPYEVEGDSNWMGRYFFTGGLMPSENILEEFSQHMTVAKHWAWDGTHYQRTAEAWLENLDRRRRDILPILESTYGPKEARRWFYRWRIFFLAVSELFGYARGSEWFISHSLLEQTGN